VECHVDDAFDALASAETVESVGDAKVDDASEDDVGGDVDRESGR
jgi:hypothetical protein